MGSKIGAMKAAASHLGFTFEEYLAKINNSLKWCSKGKHWTRRINFDKDASRGDGLCTSCRICRMHRKTTGPTRRERRAKKAVGLAWCRDCKQWLAIESVRCGLCRICQNKRDRERYATDINYRSERRQHAHARKRGIAKIPLIGQMIITEDFNGRCAYCGAPATTWDHIKPISKGGQTIPGNIVPACQSCNSSKKDKNVWNWITSNGIRPLDAFYDRIILMAIEGVALNDDED